METFQMVKDLQFDDAYMYRYNVREGTAAADTMVDDVPDQEKGRRLSMIIDLQRAITRSKRESRTGQVYKVLPEKWSKKDPTKILGLTSEDLMIIFDGVESDFNTIVEVKAVSLDGNTLHGVKL
jgi:tRNA-2-methylthio-N6-dimethylallyladenosine synthase